MARAKASKDKGAMKDGQQGPSKKNAEIPKPVITIRRFAITYLILMGAFFLLIGLKPVQNIIDLNGLYSRSIVTLTSKVLELLGIPSTCQGSVIRLPSIALDVRFGCNGLEAVMILTVAIISFPARWKYKLMGIAGGFVLIQAINILRISALAYSAIHFKAFFETIHIYIAQGMMIAVSLGIFFLYLNYAKIPRKTNS